jgi:hypothetical protein
MVTLSRKRRWMRVLSVRSSQVPATDTPSAMAAIRISPLLPWSAPSASSASQIASNASGRAASSASTNAASIRPGSWR